MSNIFEELQKQVIECRKREIKEGVNSRCYSVTRYKSYGGHDPLIILPGDSTNTQVVTVSVNPNWTCHIDKEINYGKINKNTGSTFHTYRSQLLSKLPDRIQKETAHLELVQCGSPSRKEAFGVMEICRPRFFDKAIATLSPKVIITIGRDAAEYFYTFSKEYRKNIPWKGLRKMHGRSVSVVIGVNKLNVVFAMQPSAGVSKENRLLAAHKIKDIYLNF